MKCLHKYYFHCYIPFYYWDNLFYLPIIMTSSSEAVFLICNQMSIANIVQLLLNMEVRDDIRAANITANIKPLAPEISTQRGIFKLIFHNASTLKG